MLPLPPFEIQRPESAAAAAALLAAHPGAMLLAGGTDLVPSMKQGLFDPPLLVDISRIPGMSEIRAGAGGAVIGAGATLHAVGRHPAIRSAWPALAAACATVATPTIRRTGTIGGNIMLDTRCRWYNQSRFWRGALGGCLKRDGQVCRVAPGGDSCYAVHSADTVPVLWLLDAEAVLVGPERERRVPLPRLYADDGRCHLRTLPGELLVSVRLPPAPRARLVHRKVRVRQAIDYALLLVAARLDLDQDGGPAGGRIVLSALGPRPVEVRGASAALAAGDARGAAELAWKQARPLPTHQLPSTWRKRMVRVEVGRAVEELLAGGGAGSARASRAAPGTARPGRPRPGRLPDG